MTTFRGTVKNGQLVFPPEVAEQLGLHEGDAVEIAQAVLTLDHAPSTDDENPFLAWIGVLPPLSEGLDAVRFSRELRDPDDTAS
ncbi:type II toxin-antitoxin system MazE family antitoxin [Deinococcus ruber]|uniref:SpoVT-AbrB domain-containing protein n=1 Tax=Deinococcus ruber TaxID=1848197 RepID=A0A918FFC8_9DEIO|nr:AbrB/MazE/SpoVT family DNA-binding domain-containing protein [Deinococcus ruber]GGR34637.1 hypothetical protein GCM10008957_50930 [Deinococcus ruber]